jgi:hypothetical protein
MVRQTQDQMTLRLLVDFYHAQNLREDGGITRQSTWREYDRRKIGQRAQYTVWGFKLKCGYVGWSSITKPHRRERLTEAEEKEGKNPGVDFFSHSEALTGLGLLEWVPHLFDSNLEQAESIHPYGIGNGDCLEDRLGTAAHEAGIALLTEGQADRAIEEGFHLAPVPHHIAQVQMIGVARLRYRPHTKLTAAWWAELHEKGEGYIQRYAALSSGTSADEPAHAASR